MTSPALSIAVCTTRFISMMDLWKSLRPQLAASDQCILIVDRPWDESKRKALYKETFGYAH